MTTQELADKYCNPRPADNMIKTQVLMQLEEDLEEIIVMASRPAEAVALAVAEGRVSNLRIIYGASN